MILRTDLHFLYLLRPSVALGVITLAQDTRLIVFKHLDRQIYKTCDRDRLEKFYISYNTLLNKQQETGISIFNSGPSISSDN